MDAWRQFKAGLKDCLSLKILAVIDIREDEGRQVIRILKNTVVQVVFYYAILGALLNYVSDWHWIFLPFYYLYQAIATIGTHGYTIIHFADLPTLYIHLIHKRKKEWLTDRFDQQAGFARGGALVVQSLLFTLTYMLLYVGMLGLTWLQPMVGLILMVLSQALFISMFTFFRKWPYDEANLAFMQKKCFYFIGFGLVPSLICNVLLGGVFSNAAFFLLNPFLIFNAIVSQPPSSRDFDAQGLPLRNSYYKHRRSYLTDGEYRRVIRSNVWMFKPFIWARLQVERFTKYYFQIK